MMTITFKSLLAFAATALVLVQSTSATPLIAARDEAAQEIPAAPADPTESQILNFALTLEHLENAFYNEALSRFPNGDFERAGFPSWVRGRFNQIKMHEQTHVQFLTEALNGIAVVPCRYKFPYSTPQQFAVLSAIFEGVGASAYLGAAKYLKNPDTLTKAGSILSVEARQSAWVTSSALHSYPWSGPFDVPLSLSQAYNLALGFIVECPGSNAALLPQNIKAFPALTIKEKSYDAGKTITVQYENSVNDLKNNERFLAFLTGLDTLYVRIGKDGKVTIPNSLQGTAYGIVTSNGAAVEDSNTVAGPMVFMVPFTSSESNS